MLVITNDFEKNLRLKTPDFGGVSILITLQ